MQHILLLIAFLSTSFALGVSLLMAFLFAKDKKKITKYYLLLLISFTGLALCHTLHLYFKINLIEYFKSHIEYKKIYEIIYSILRAIFIYLIPQFFYNFNGILFTTKRKIYFTFLAITPLFVIAFFMFFFNNILPFVLRTHIVITSLVFLYFFGITISRVKKIKTENNTFVVKNKGFVKIVTALFIFMFIIYLITIVLFLIKNNQNENYFFYLRNISFFIMFFVINVINVLLILLGYKFPHANSFSTKFIIPQTFIEEYHITSRELEIIKLILSGKSNKEISDILFRSQKTIQNHIYNIYQKTGANSRMHLNNIINTS